MGDTRPTARRPRVLLDCDGVLADFIGAAVRVVNRELGTEHTPAGVTAFDFCRSLGLSASESARVKRAIGSDRGFAARLDVLHGAVGGVRHLGNVAEIYVVTSPWNSNATWVNERERWLLEHFNIIPGRVIHTSAKHVCVGDFLVDDKVETLETWQTAHPSGLAVKWLTPHNRLDTWAGVKTRSWDELAELVSRREIGGGA